MFENKLGMFIHWGVYAMTGVHEQVFARMNLPREEYESLYHSFNPVKFDPDAWVLLAKNAGMEYICFTAKHHDGFCMWDTGETDYSIMHTPYGKDVLKLLADACARHGMKLSLYYSCPDWHHPCGYNPLSTHQWKAVQEKGGDHRLYLEYVKQHVRELLTGYGSIYTFFWDIPPKIMDPSFNEMIRELQPGILINDRGYDTGDFSTPEREYQSAQGTRFTRMTEACNSVGEQSWGYRSNEDFHSLRYLTYSIDTFMAMGASYLLNVGPNADGVIPEEYASRIRRVGDWYNRMEGCLCNHESDDYDYRIRGKKVIVTQKNGRSYFHFHNGLPSSAFSLGRFPSIPTRVRLMNSGEELSYRVCRLPEFMMNEQEAPHLHISGINVDLWENEPIVVEISWQ